MKYDPFEMCYSVDPTSPEWCHELHEDIPWEDCNIIPIKFQMTDGAGGMPLIIGYCNNCWPNAVWPFINKQEAEAYLILSQ